MSSCLRSIQNIFVPTITHVRVLVYENGEKRDTITYDEHRLHALMESINTLWKVPDNSSFWFETEIWEKTSCFHPRRADFYVVCYKEDVMATGFKRKMAIPIRYRKKMFDQRHPIRPEAAGNIKWPENMFVEFTLLEN